MINLLPKRAYKKVSHEYYTRLITLFFLVMSAVFCFSTLLFLPSYFLVRDEAQEAARFLEAAETQAQLREESEKGRQVAALAEKQRILFPYTKQVVVSTMLETLLRAKPDGVSITELAYVHGDGETRLSFSGEADTRSALVSFTDNLKKTAAFRDVSLPVSSLIADSDIPFSFSLTYRHTDL